MRFEREDLEAEVAAAARDFLSRAWDPETRRASLASDALPPALWAQAAAIGWFDLIVPEDRGGLGLGPVELGAVFEEAGRGLFPGPLFDTAVVGALCRARGADLPAGSVVAFAHAENGRSPLASSDTVMEAGAVEGDKTLVPYADCADAMLVLVRGDSGRAVVRVSGDGAGLDRIPVRSVDVVSRPCTVRLTGAPVDEVVVHGEDTEAFLQRLEVLAYAMHAARILGAAECLLEMSVEYAKDRHQFGRPIGSFQAVQHRLADMRVALRTLRSTCYVSQITLAEGDAKAPHWARVAKAHASNVIRSVAESAVQVHGGIGFTVEHDLHLYLKHGLSLQAMWGDGPQHQQAVADELIKRIAAPQEAIGA